MISGTTDVFIIAAHAMRREAHVIALLQISACDESLFSLQWSGGSRALDAQSPTMQLSNRHGLPNANQMEGITRLADSPDVALTEMVRSGHRIAWLADPCTTSQHRFGSGDPVSLSMQQACDQTGHYETASRQCILIWAVQLEMQASASSGTAQPKTKVFSCKHQPQGATSGSHIARLQVTVVLGSAGYILRAVSVAMR